MSLDKRKRHTLYSDKTASQRELEKRQQQEEQRAAGIITPAMDLFRKPVQALLDQYHQNLAAHGDSPAHVEISQGMLDRMAKECKWRTMADVTAQSVKAFLAHLVTAGRTVSYANKFIMRAKAFVNATLPQGCPSPLQKLRRIREKGAKRNRARRAMNPAEAQAFFATWQGLPEYRRTAYALLMLNGLRRNEARDLRWSQLGLKSPVPFVTLPQKCGDGKDIIPLHPYVVRLLTERMEAMPDARVLLAVPDVKTFKKDLHNAGIDFTDAEGLRLDIHALRHTFTTNLDRAGVSRATKKRLTRHANEDVTDGYTHADLAESLEALRKLASPDNADAQTVPMLRTGTDDSPLQIIGPTVDRQVDQLSGFHRALSSIIHKNALSALVIRKQTTPASDTTQTPVNTGFGEGFRTADLSPTHRDSRMVVPRPDTQVD